MLQYDLTQTRFFDAPTRASLPSDAELFVVTTALLLLRKAAFSELGRSELCLAHANIGAVVACIEERLPELARDLQLNVPLRERLSDLVGIRICSI